MSAAGWTAALETFADYLAGTDRSEATCAGYLRHLGWLSDAESSKDPWSVEARDLRAWLDGQNWSRETRRKVVVSVRIFYSWAVGEGYLDWSPTSGLPTLAAKKRGPKQLPMPAQWVEPFELYEAACRARAQSEHTIEQHRWYLRRLAECARDPWSITTQQLEVWIGNPDWAPQTKRSARSHVSGFYRWAARCGYLLVSPCQDLDPVRVPRALPRPAPLAAVREALSKADDRTRLAVKLAVYAGLRRAEIARIHTSEITPTHLVVNGKGGHQRFVPLHPDLAGEVAAELARRRDGRHGSGWSGRFVSEPGYLFPSDRSPDPIAAATLGKIVRRVLPGDWTTHTLRHTFATAAYAQDRDLLAVQTLLGHARPESTAGYAAVPDGALRAAVGAVVL